MVPETILTQLVGYLFAHLAFEMLLFKLSKLNHALLKGVVKIRTSVWLYPPLVSGGAAVPQRLF